jgi:hypothetical protein
VSLIDDALKRAQAADDAAARSAERPWTPTPMPDPAIARRRALARWAGIAGAVAILAAAGAWLAKRIAPDVSARTVSLRPTDPVPAAVLPAATVTPDAVALATPVVVAPPAARLSAGSLTPPPTRRPRPTPVAPAAAESPPEAPEGSVAPPAPTPAPPPRPREAAGGRTYAGSATVPGGARIEVGGIVWSETEPRALVNDRILGVGSYVEGWSIKTIEEDRVVLEKDGSAITITVR